jgi:hypothetical protein
VAAGEHHAVAPGFCEHRFVLGVLPGVDHGTEVDVRLGRVADVDGGRSVRADAP